MDENTSRAAWGVIEWSMTAGFGVMAFILGYLTLFLSKKWNADIKRKISEYDLSEIKYRKLRQEKYELEMNVLNNKLEGLIDKLESSESEIRSRDGILDRIKDLENSVRNMKER